MASTPKPTIKVFFNDEIKKKFEEVFSTKPFIFDNYFDVKEDLNFGFNLEFMSIMVMHKWESLVQQKGEIFSDLVREFYVHLVSKDSPFSHDSRNLTEAEAKEKGKGKLSEPNPKSDVAKTMPVPTSFPEEPTPTKSEPAE
ncbi:hypothetical protein V6N11_080442 [Hibiscus sabdariffa]|uniref:Uncharacterized protein n=1 Tax=Hibiscus sabdariffa TaxID=183260 RepID=A0ABR2R7Q3_9ROSI